MANLNENLLAGDFHKALTEGLRPADIIDAEVVEELTKAPDAFLGAEEAVADRFLRETVALKGFHKGFLINVGLRLHWLQFEVDAIGIILADLGDFAETVNDAEVGSDRKGLGGLDL